MIIVFLLFSFSLSIYDIKYKKVPNIVLFILFILSLLNKIFINRSITTSFLNLGISLLTLLLVYFISKGKLGMGDIKFSSIIAFEFGYKIWVYSLLYCSFIALIISLVLVKINKINTKTKIPFIPFISAGLLLELYNFYFL